MFAPNVRWILDRRHFLAITAGTLSGLVARGVPLHGQTRLPFGLVTDPHYADANPLGPPFYL